MKLHKMNDTVAFIVNDTYLFGVIKNRDETEDGMQYTIATARKIFVKVAENQIIHNYGEIDDE